MEKRKIEELAAISKFHPDLRTVVVEGEDDRRVYGEFVKWCDFKDVAVIPISTIEVELPSVVRAGAGGGNRARVIELACKLVELSAEPGVVLCVVDTDLGFVLPKGPDVEGLVYTNVTSLELFYWCSNALDVYVGKYLGGEALRGVVKLEVILPVLKKMFCIRVAITQLGMPLSWIDDCPCHSWVDGVLGFDSSEYLSRLLHKTGNFPRRDEVLAAMARVEVQLSGEDACYIHGHDFMSVLRFLLIKLKISNKLVGDRFTLFRVFALCKEFSALEASPTFSAIKTFGLRDVRVG